MPIKTVGFVFEEGEDFVTILQSYDERASGIPHGDHYICVPKFSITRSITFVESKPHK